jgi:4-diphosphocytidyl-2-C-methyl-D-erythritol kinase
LLALAARLGADVPFFASGHPAALVSGIGTSMEELPAPLTAAGVMLVTPADRLSTAAVFAEFDRQGTTRGPSSETGATAAADELAEALRAGLDGAGLAAWAGRLHGANDLWAAASRLSPGLATARDGLEQALGRPFLLTGSGTTLFAVYPSAEAAADAARQLERARPGSLRDATIDASATSSREGSP